MDVQMLLRDISGITKKYQLINQKTGGFFNVFEILNVATDEVKICRIITELLRSDGLHHQGSLYLKSFFSSVLKINIDDNEIKSAKVYREYHIENKRRIDIVIKTKNFTIPIEVKIYAQDQEDQCTDYAKWAKNSKVYYLTRFGDLPTEYSAGVMTKTNNQYNEIECISFSKDILIWLEKCVTLGETIKISPIREVILQLMSAIRIFTDQREDEEKMDILDVLTQSPEHMKNAVAIKDNVNLARCMLMDKMFKLVEKKVDREKLDNEYDYSFQESKKINDFYKYQYSTYPGISYMYRSEVKKDVDIWVRIEIADRIFVGYCCPVNGKSVKQILSDDEIMNILNVEPNIDNWWAYWEYLPEDERDFSPGFKHPNDLYFSLYDSNKMDEFTDICVRKINELLNR